MKCCTWYSCDRFSQTALSSGKNAPKRNSGILLSFFSTILLSNISSKLVDSEIEATLLLVQELDVVDDFWLEIIN